MIFYVVMLSYSTKLLRFQQCQVSLIGIKYQEIFARAILLLDVRYDIPFYNLHYIYVFASHTARVDRHKSSHCSNNLVICSFDTDTECEIKIQAMKFIFTSKKI